MLNRCFCCYEPLSEVEVESDAGKSGFHVRCSQAFFGRKVPPAVDFGQNQLLELAEQVVKSHKTVTGVQPKLSLGLSKKREAPDRFTLVGVWGEYILKPQTEHFLHLPENEDLTMHLAESCKIMTVPHTLVRMSSGDLAYITKRIDRQEGRKIPMEDMCQLTERLTEHKYRGSYEQIAKAIHRYSSNPGLDVVNFYEVVLFSFLTGNNDMHLKNFSLIHSALGYGLSAAYDLVASQLVVEGDDEELALNLNGKKKKLRKSDFIEAMKSAHIPAKTIDSVFVKIQDVSGKWPSLIERSFLPSDTQAAYKELIRQKIGQLFG